MRSFRHAVRRSRWLIILIILCNFSYSVEAYTFVSAYQRDRQEEKRLQEMADRLGVPVEKLRREQPGLIDSLRNTFLNEEAEARRVGQTRVEAQLAKMAEQVAANPYRSQIDEVKRSYQSHRLDGLLRDLTELSTTDVLSLPAASRKALLKNVRESLKEDLEPYVPDNLPGKAKGKHNQLRGRLRSLYVKLRKIVNEPDALSDPKLSQTLGRIAAEVNGEVHRPQRGPRFAGRPLPLQLREQTIRTEEVTQPIGAPSPAVVAGTSAAASSPGPLRIGAAAAATASPEIAALAQSLGNSPARIFAHVHDNIRFDPKWGAVRSPVGTLQEGEGTSWDQAWLLMELLTAAGVEAKVEWGQVEVPISLLLTLTGTSDPFDAGNLLSTGGVPAVLLVQGGRVVGARLGHVWVKAYIDYIPNRGATPGTPDMWVRMDPSFKHYGFTAGIDVHSQVPFDLGNYLQSGTELSPRRSYEDALWSYIRTNRIDCVNLEQLKKSAAIERERFPFVPGTLRGEIVRVDGEQAAVPASFQQSLTLEVKNAAGSSLVSWSTPAPAVYGKRVEIDYLGATPEDQATLNAYGGVFETPPYLVDLKPVVRVAGATVAQGAAVESAADTEVWVTMTPPAAAPTVVTHVTSAGERHILAADFGEIPQPVIDAHLAAQSAARAAGNASEEEAETLFLIGAQYLHNLGRDLSDLSGWKWQRLVRLGTEGLISQTGVVTTTLGGAPISFHRGQRNVDIALMPLGMVPADGRRQFRREAFELLGSQSSFLEGEVFNQVLQREGIASVSALTHSKRAGQTLTRVDGSNVNAVLEQADLGTDAEAEIREGVSRGRIAWVAESRIALQQWTGTGYVIEDPTTGAAAYLISGGFAGGDETGGEVPTLQDLFGTESWLGGTPLWPRFQRLLALLGQGSPESSPSTQQSDPVNLSTGNLWRAETDLVIQARGLPIFWSRTYNSRSGKNSQLGFGWSFSYGERLEERADGSVEYQEQDGTEHLFFPMGSGSYQGPPGKHLSLTKHGNGFVLLSKDGSEAEFSLDGRLLAVADRNGNRTTLEYDSSGDLRSIHDSAGRLAISLTVEGGKITQITDLAGRSVRYAYSGSDLVNVTDAAGKVWTYSYDEDHNLIAVHDPLGNIDSFAFDALDRCYRHVDPLGNEEAFSYARRGERAVLTGRRGADVYLEFDGRGRATFQVDPLGNVARSVWDNDNNLTSSVDHRGGVTTRSYDERGNLLSVTDPLDQTTTYTYDPTFSQVLTEVNPLGQMTTSTYDGSGNLTQITRQVGSTAVTESFAYDSFGQVTEIRDANGELTRLTWNTSTGALEKQTDALNRSTTMTTDVLGRISEIRDPSGTVTSAVWDSRDRLASVTDPYGNEVELTYDNAGRKVAMTTPLGTRSTSYDAVGRPVQITDPLGNSIRMDYDADGNMISRRDARGNRTTLTYDPIGRVSSRINSLNQIWTYGYCADIGSGDRSAGACEIVDPLGQTTRQNFDELGRVVQQTDPLGHVTRYTYDALGRRTAAIDALNRAVQYEYDTLGRLAAVVEPNGARTRHNYDGNGNRTRTVDAEGREWLYTYDSMNQLKTEKDPLGNTTTYAYDTLGNLRSKQDAKGQSISYEYDVRRLKAVVLPNGTRESFAYDSMGRVTSLSNAEIALSYSYDTLGRMVQVTDQTLGKTINYEFDAAGNRVAMESPRGRVTYVYDAENRLVELRDPATGVYQWKYDLAGRIEGLEYPNGLDTQYEHDAGSRLASVIVRNAGGQVVDGYRYQYDEVGNRISKQSLQDSAEDSFEYDAANRLKEWRNGSGFERYSYDQVGNRLSKIDEIGVVTYSYDAANRLISETRDTGEGRTLSEYEWDLNGNLVRKTAGSASTTYQYDPLNRLVQVAGAEGIHTYGYSPTGVRVRETVDTETQRFLYSREDLIGVFGSDGTLKEYFTHGPGTDEPLAQVSTSAGGVSYLHRDGLGSITALSDSAGQLAGSVRYAAFGKAESVSGATSRYGFTGRELDSTGLMYYRARYYDPAVGRFTSTDPFSGLLDQPASLHRFAYAHNDPVNLTDPSGLMPSFGEALESFWNTLGGYVGTFVILLSEIVDGLSTSGPTDINRMGPELAATRGRVFGLLGNLMVVIGVVLLFDSVFSDNSLNFREKVLKFFVSLLWSMLANYLIGKIVSSMTTLSGGALAKAILIFVGLNVLLTAMVAFLTDETFAFGRQYL